MNIFLILEKKKLRKISISNNENGKNRKYEDMRECMKEATHRVLKLAENWADEGSIAGIIDTDRMVRRDDFGGLEKWMCQPRSIGRHNKRIHIFFKCKQNIAWESYH